LPPNSGNTNVGWLNNCTILTSSGDIIAGCKEIAGNTVFKKNTIYEITPHIVSSNVRCVFLHDKCWKFIKNKYGIKLDYSMIKPINDKIKINILAGVDYGIVEKYWEQFFDFDRAPEYMRQFESPKNIARMKKIIRQMKLSKLRVGPNISATFDEDGSIRMGNDRMFWQNKNGKWVRLVELGKVSIKSIPKNKINLSKITGIPQICESSKCNTKSVLINNNKPKFTMPLFVKISDKIYLYSAANLKKK
jgi:hypothetical protein